MKINIHNVALKAHVSISTVSRVLNNSGYASPVTCKKVLQAVEALGYRKNRIAMSLRMKTSRFVGLIVPDISNEFYAAMAKEIEAIIKPKDYNLFLGNSSWSSRKELDQVNSLLDNQVSGIILASCSDSLPRSILASSVPKVIIDNAQSDVEIENALFIESDNYNGAKQAAGILLAQKARSFVYIKGHQPSYPMSQREKGFLDTMKENGISPALYRVYNIMVSTNEAFQLIKKIFDDFQFDAVFCSTDTIALGVVKGLLDLGIKIPDRVQVMGFDGISLGEFIYPPLSTIKQDIHEMGTVIGESIFNMMNDVSIKRHIVIPVSYIQRSTTKRTSE